MLDDYCFFEVSLVLRGLSVTSLNTTVSDGLEEVGDSGQNKKLSLIWVWLIVRAN